VDCSEVRSFRRGGSIEYGPGGGWIEVTVQRGWLISISISSGFFIPNSIDSRIAVGGRWKGDMMWLWLRSSRMWRRRFGRCRWWLLFLPGR
jgi:hypothetical protein